MAKYSGEAKVEKVGASFVSVTFRENRKFDLHVGRNMVTFLGRETKSIPSEWLKHSDWKQVVSLFIVKGV